MATDTTHLDVVPLDAPLGAEILNLDLTNPLSAATVHALEDAWRKYLVLVIRGQSLSDQQLLALSRNFGELDPPGPNPYGESFLPEYPEINVISNVIENGRHLGNLGDGEAVWHADMTYIETPPKAAILYSLEVPEGQGDTYFADMFAAYEALPDDFRSAIEGKAAIHDSAHNSAGMLRKGYSELSDVRQTPGAHHPLVRTEPGTGRRALFLGRRPHAYIVGMDVAESEALLDRLWAHIEQPRFAMRHSWRVGDVLMWRNLSVLHRRDAFDPASRRIMHRTQIKGDERIL
jgi:taurine dioxygenase